MAETISFTVDGYDLLADCIEEVRKAAPDIMLKHINRAGNRFKKDCIEETEAKVKKRKGDLIRGYRKTVITVFRNGGFDHEAQITGGNKKARHFHLIENGHRQTAEYFYKQGYKTICHSNNGYVKGFKIVGSVRDRWNGNNLVAEYAEAAVKEALKKGAIE